MNNFFSTSFTRSSKINRPWRSRAASVEQQRREEVGHNEKGEQSPIDGNAKSSQRALNAVI